MDLVKGIVERIANPTLQQMSPAYEHATNGVVERAIQDIDDQVRVLLLGLQEHTGAFIPMRHACIAWRVQHAADLYNNTIPGKRVCPRTSATLLSCRAG